MLDKSITNSKEFIEFRNLVMAPLPKDVNEVVEIILKNPPEEFSNWVESNVNMLKYVYTDHILNCDCMDLLPFAMFTIESYIRFKCFENGDWLKNIRTEIEDITSPNTP